MTKNHWRRVIRGFRRGRQRRCVRLLRGAFDHQPNPTTRAARDFALLETIEDWCQGVGFGSGSLWGP